MAMASSTIIPKRFQTSSSTMLSLSRLVRGLLSGMGCPLRTQWLHLPSTGSQWSNKAYIDG